MKVLVIGSGAREHALCWKISKSPLVEKVYCIPGNPGIAAVATVVPEPKDLVAFATEHGIALTVVGPENYLAGGIVDRFRSAGLKIVGPTKAAAQLESSKAFAKEVLNAAEVPTAPAVVCESVEDALSQLRTRWDGSIVVKADGLASGKGVTVCQTYEQAEKAIAEAFGTLESEKLLLEKTLSGREVSFIVAARGTTAVPLASAHDYKRLEDGDHGPNTGGMGSVSPSPRLSPEDAVAVMERVIYPVLREMEHRGIRFSGFLYAGLMVPTTGEINVLEFNTRLGDPEAQVILRQSEDDLVPLLEALADHDAKTPLPELEWNRGASVGVVLASRGYPQSPQTGDAIHGLELASALRDVAVFHAGTAHDGKDLVTSGGRILTVTASADTIDEARARVYQAVDMIQFKGRQARRDIGYGA